MRNRRPAIIITAILALGMALAAVSSSAIAAATRHAPSSRVEVTVVNSGPNIMFHG
jgi:hypothetical protein